MRRRCKKKHGSQDLGRSRGGFSTKIHIAADALGLPVKFILTSGERNDITEAANLIEGFEFECLIADKGYDSNEFVETVRQQKAEAVIPPRACRTEPREYDRDLYRERHLIECFIGKLKQYRRVFSRFEKLSKNYLAFVQFAAALIWLR